MKTIVIGCTHAGTAAVKNMLKLYPNMDVTVYERNDNVSFLSCGIALYVGGVVKDKSGLFYSSPEELARLGAKTLMLHEVQTVDFAKKELKVKDLTTGIEFTDSYDKLVIATGSWPIVPRIEGIQSENVLLSKNYNQANEIIRQTKNIQKVVVVGAGYIGVELAEAFTQNGKEVVLIDAEERIMPRYLDKEFTDIAEAKFMEKGVRLSLGEKVSSFVTQGNRVVKVVTNKNTYDTDLVIMSIGFRANTGLFQEIEKTPGGSIIVDEYMRTSIEDVYACGDCASIHYNPANDTRSIPLATNAIRMGTLVAYNLMGPKIAHQGTQGTSGIQIYELSISSTGINETVAKETNLDYLSATIHENNRPEFMPTFEDVMLKIVFDRKTRKLLGGQVLSKVDVTSLMNTLSVCIQKEMTVEELAFVDFFFQPHFNKPWNLLNLVALKALDVK